MDESNARGRGRPANDSLTRREFLERGAVLGASLGMYGVGVSGLLLPRGLGLDETLEARASQRGQELTLSNGAISASWAVTAGRLRAVRVVDPAARRTLALVPDAFTILLAGGEPVRASDMRLTRAPRIEVIEARGATGRASERLRGRELRLEMEDYARRLRVEWSAELRDGSRYVRQQLAVRPIGRDIAIDEVMMVDVDAPGIAASGSVAGSPLVFPGWFASVEHPLAVATITGTRGRSSLRRQLPLRVGTTLDVSSVIGIAGANQLRRDFLTYLERERAHPYRTFLHYNSWYDLGYFSKFNEAEALAVIRVVGEELHRKRGVVLDSFLFDDGWDDPKTLWGFHAGFPNGFSALRREAGRYGAAPGVWMSPWGGYGKPKEDRLLHGRRKGYETNAGGFALSGPVYYQRFVDTCLEMMRSYGVNQFKFDGTGNADRAFRGSAFGSDFEAAIALIERLRRERSSLYVNLTTGTYPSPFWLRWADSIWRGGEDHEFLGVGSERQRWITYRDADTFANVVGRGPLYPLNSLMLHGLIYARSARGLQTDPQNDFAAEIRSYFGSGTQLQEMYVTPRLLKPAQWDVLADSAKWSRRHAGTLVDTHWIGGDPARLQPYGWASWTPRGGILTVRNPSDKVQPLLVDVAQAFELPEGAAQVYSARNPWGPPRARAAPIRLVAGREHRVDLQPFEVLTLEATPAQGR